MKRATSRLPAILSLAVAGVLAAGTSAAQDAAKGSFAADSGMTSIQFAPKAASTRQVASRAVASPSQTVFGGFELAQSAVVYVLVRGNSMGSLGVTQNFLDRPRFRLYNQAGQDLVFDNANRPGFNFCSTSNSDDVFVINYYQARGAPVSTNDACLGATFASGVYTFSVTPATTANSGLTSSPSTGEILFEVILGP